MKDTTPSDLGLSALIDYLRDGRYVIPDFQREFEWKPWHIRQLLRSIFRDYYIGNLLLWKGEKQNFEALSCEPLYGFSGRSEQNYIVLDGQQRLTALYYAFFAPSRPLPYRKMRAVYYIRIDRFMDDEDEEAFAYWFASSKNIEQWLEDRKQQYDDHEFPVAMIGSQDAFALWEWLDGYKRHWSSVARDKEGEGDGDALEQARCHERNAEKFKQHIKELMNHYNISYIELDKNLELDKVCNIFQQINSQGVQLKVFDLMNALLKPKDIRLKGAWRSAAGKFEYVTPSGMKKMQVYVLQVMSILKQSYCSPRYLYNLIPGQEKSTRGSGDASRKKVLIPDAEHFMNDWKEAVSALERAIRSLRDPKEFGAIKFSFLPYFSILPIFAALQASLKSLEPAMKLKAQERIRLWYWRSVFHQRYSSAVESTSAADFQDVKKWIKQEEIPDFMKGAKLRLEDLNLVWRVNRPGPALYNGIFNLLILRGARDWVSGKIPASDEIDDHHIIPVAHKIKGLKSGLVNTILNRTPLTAETNRNVIGDKLPNEYLPDMIEKSGEEQVRKILKSHFISRKALKILLKDPFTSDDFMEFIGEREIALQAEVDERLGQGQGRSV